MEERVIRETSLPLKLYSRGKVRDIWDLGERLLIVATDRISAFDVVMQDPIPGKGKILNRMSNFWFQFCGSFVDTHFITTDLAKTNRHEVWTHISENDLDGRSMIVWKAEPTPIECVVRGYLAGSGWQEYQKTGEVCGIRLPSGLQESDRLPNPIFTPATKEETGMHDQNISYNEMVWKLHDWMRGKEIKTDQIINHGSALAFWLRSKSLEIYKKAAEYALERGIIIADTKLEFGSWNGRPILVDEVLTPDSSRFWPADKWQPGRTQESFDKQFLRDYLISIGWNREPPPPPLPEEVIRKTQEKYQEAFRKLTS